MLHRKLLDWEWYSKPVVKSVFIHSLLRANHKDGKWQGKEIKRGSFISSINKISSEIGHSVQEIKTALKHLKSTNELTTKGNTQHTVFTVVNYENYQGLTSDLTNEQPTVNQRATTNNNDNNEKNDKKKDIKPRAKAKASAKKDESLLMAYLPLKDGSKFELRQSQTDKWIVLYPGLDLKTEVNKMIGWLDANPAKRKTNRGMLKFMNGWLSRAQDSAKSDKDPMQMSAESNWHEEELGL